MSEYKDKNEDKFITVEVMTVSGGYPEEGVQNIPIHQKVNVLLEKASKELGIISTEGFVASIEGQEIDINKSYEDLGLTGSVEIDWSKREGGGGYA